MKIEISYENLTRIIDLIESEIDGLDQSIRSMQKEADEIKSKDELSSEDDMRQEELYTALEVDGDRRRELSRLMRYLQADC